MRALQYLIARAKKESERPEVRVLHVQPPLPESLLDTVDPQLLARARDEQAETATGWAHDLLARAGLPHMVEIETGDPSHVIAQYAKAHDCDEIVMGTRGLSAIKGLVIGSVAYKVLHFTDRPVLLVK